MAIEVLKGVRHLSVAQARRSKRLDPANLPSPSSVRAFHFAPEGDYLGRHLASFLKSGHREVNQPIRSPASVASNPPCVIDHRTLSQHPGHGEEVDL